jgi:hypothetical protein
VGRARLEGRFATVKEKRRKNEHILFMYIGGIIIGNLIEAPFGDVIEQQMSAMKPGYPPLFRELSDEETASLYSDGQNKGILYRVFMVAYL